MKAATLFLICTVLVIQVYSQQNYYRQQNVDPNAYSRVQSRPQTGACADENGRYATATCDGYIECKDGIPAEKTCPDGLLFNPAVGPQAFPCQYPIDVDCTGRTQTQPALATDECPHQFGYYRLGDAANCGQFKNCVNGKGFTFDCPEGLAFNEESYRCDWPDQVPACDAEAYLGFSCPPDARQFGLGDEEYRSFRSPSDCQRYFICVKSRPRLYNCGEGRAFNDLINACDGVENVTGCALPARQQPNQVGNNEKYAPVQLKGPYRQTSYRG